MNYYNEIKSELVNNLVYKKVKDYSKNREDLKTYYNVGKMLSEAGKHYGQGIIKEYSLKLSDELNKNYSTRVLYKMLKYYKYVDSQKLPTLSAKLSWSHYDELLKLNDSFEINYYTKIIETQNLSVRELRNKIKNKEYERLDPKTKEKLMEKDEIVVSDFIKKPIYIKNNLNKEKVSEKILQQLIMEDLDNFLKELGDGFSYIGSEYKVKIGNSYNYIDLFLFNIKFNCYVVVELKITELKKEHIGQIETYMNYIDKNIKRVDQDKTIGIIIVRKDNKFILEYSSDEEIFTTNYEFI